MMKIAIACRFFLRSVIATFLLLCSFSILGSAQEIIRGRVTDSEGIPLSGATVFSRTSGKTSLTDSTGFFSITASSGNVLTISFVGYREVQYTVGTVSDNTIVLQTEIKSLNDVVFLGYGSSRKKDITGAVTRITNKDFNNGIITNPMQQLQGKVAGLVVVQPGGDPNGDFIVRVRGATSLEGQPPLLVIDGVAIDDFQRANTSLNPADIESYDILKDASAAAIYGSRGANGVILVTTKKGVAGKTNIDYQGFFGVEKFAGLIETLTADKWREVTGPAAAQLDKGGNTDWQKEITQTAYSQSHTIGISGGTNLIQYRASVGYNKQDGVVLNSGKEIISSRLNVLQKSFNSKLEIAYAANFSVINRDFLPDQSSTNQVTTGGAFAFSQALTFLPVWPVYNPDGSYYMPPVNNPFNPVFLLNELYSKKRENFFQGSVKIDYEVIPGLKLGMLGAFTNGNDVYDRFWQAVDSLGAGSTGSKYNYNKQNFTGDLHISYKKSIGRHHFDFTGVYEYNRFLNDAFGVTASGFLLPDLLNNNLGTATSVRTSDLQSYKTEVKLISFLGRLVYNFDERFIFTTNFRRDGSSKFGPNNRWANFPSFALAWRINNEKFLENVKWLDNLKLRASYGFTGNQENLPANKYQQLYGPTGPYLYNGQFFQSYSVQQEYNPDLKWEVRQSFNIGLDFSVFKDRFFGTLDYFNDHTNDMLFLYDIPQPPFLTNKVYANAASAVNKGLELTLGAAVFRNKNFSWDIQGNISFLKNHITELLSQFKGYNLSLNNPGYGSANGGGFGFSFISLLKIGHPAGVFWIPEHAGQDADGHELFNNYDADGKLVGISTSYTDQDRVLIDPTPDFTWGITNNFRLGNFDLGIFIRGVQGQKIFSNSLLRVENAGYLPGSNVTEKALTNGFTDLPQPSTYWLRDGSYARCENITLGYNFKNIKRVNMLRVYLVTNNLFIIRSYEGADPEISTDGPQRYIDQNYYPKTRGISIGLNVSFNSN